MAKSKDQERRDAEQRAAERRKKIAAAVAVMTNKG